MKGAFLPKYILIFLSALPFCSQNSWSMDIENPQEQKNAIQPEQHQMVEENHDQQLQNEQEEAEQKQKAHAAAQRAKKRLGLNKPMREDRKK